jgi:hypothetical protein
VIPAGSKALVAVDDPSLLDFARFKFATLDLVGAVSPHGSMPVYQGPQAIISYLKSLGYHYIVTDNPAASGLYNLAQWQYTAAHGDYSDSRIADYFVSWQHSIDRMIASPHIQSEGVAYFKVISLDHPRSN